MSASTFQKGTPSPRAFHARPLNHFKKALDSIPEWSGEAPCALALISWLFPVNHETAISCTSSTVLPRSTRLFRYQPSFKARASCSRLLLHISGDTRTSNHLLAAFALRMQIVSTALPIYLRPFQTWVWLSAIRHHGTVIVRASGSPISSSLMTDGLCSVVMVVSSPLAMTCSVVGVATSSMGGFGHGGGEEKSPRESDCDLNKEFW